MCRITPLPFPPFLDIPFPREMPFFAFQIPSEDQFSLRPATDFIEGAHLDLWCGLQSAFAIYSLFYLLVLIILPQESRGRCSTAHLVPVQRSSIVLQRHIYSS